MTTKQAIHVNLYRIVERAILEGIEFHLLARATKYCSWKTLESDQKRRQLAEDCTQAAMGELCEVVRFDDNENEEES
jgi:hypothetical protein